MNDDDEVDIDWREAANETARQYRAKCEVADSWWRRACEAEAERDRLLESNKALAVENEQWRALAGSFTLACSRFPNRE